MIYPSLLKESDQVGTGVPNMARPLTKDLNQINKLCRCRAVLTVRFNLEQPVVDVIKAGRHTPHAVRHTPYATGNGVNLRAYLRR